jgi:DNA modification methylase
MRAKDCIHPDMHIEASLTIIYRKTADLLPYAQNSRTHSDEQVAQIAASIAEFGFTNPVLIDEQDGIIAGHGRILAAEKRRMEEVPTITLSGLSEAQKRAYIIADNKLALNAGWDEAMLAVEFQELEELGYDLELTGFSLDEIEALTVEKTAGKTDPDDAPPIPANPVSMLGDVWLLGKHRLMCGDSTSLDAVRQLCYGDGVDMIFTDPPYGVSIGSKNAMLNTFQPSRRCCENIENDTMTPADLKVVLLAAFSNANIVLNDCGAVYVASPQGGGLGMMMMMMEAGLEVRHILNWVKNSPTFSMGWLDYDYQHEPILFTWKKTHKKIMGGDHRSSCWFVDKPRESKLHPTMKPVALPVNAILNSSEPNDVVLDLFGGAGSTLIACEKTGRRCRMMELDPKYVDVILRRWQEFVGKAATLESDGRTFAEVEHGRKA